MPKGRRRKETPFQGCSLTRACDARHIHCQKQNKDRKIPGSESKQGRLSSRVTRGLHVRGDTEPVQGWVQPRARRPQAGRRGPERLSLPLVTSLGRSSVGTRGLVTLDQNIGGTRARSGLPEPGRGGGWPEAEAGAARGAGVGGRAARAWACPLSLPSWPRPPGWLGGACGRAQTRDVGNRPVAPERPAAAASVGIHNSHAALDGCHWTGPRGRQGRLSRLFYDG